MKRLILVIFGLLGLSSCFNETAYRTNFIVQPFMQSESGGDMESLEGVVAYAFAGSIEGWEVSSIEDALSGIITSTTSNELRGALAIADPYSGSYTDLAMLVEQESIFVVVADPVSEIYAYSDYIIPINLEELYVTVTFRSWKTEDYTSSTWTFIVPESEEDDEDEEDDDIDIDFDNNFDFNEDDLNLDEPLSDSLETTLTE